MSNNKDNAPFYVGQRVVCVKSGSTFPIGYCIEKDSFYTVSEIHFHFWAGMVVKTEETGPAMWAPSRFAPIEPRHHDVEIAEELLKEPIPETLDVLPVLS